MSKAMTRREVLAAGAVGPAIAASGLAAASKPDTAQGGKRVDPFKICFNTSTLRARKLPITDIVDVVAEAGYGGIEIWVDEIDRHVTSGGTLKDLDRRIKDRGLVVTGAIAFFEWMVDDDARRAGGFESAKQHMARLAEIGCTHIAAAPCGDVERVELLRAAERYRELLEVGEKFGVVPAVEIWGPARNLFRLGQAVLVAIEANHPKACILPDVYHLYKGGSGLSGVGRLNAHIIAGFHLNDYPADPPRETITDRHRVYPGDGIAPLGQLIRDLRTIGYRGPLSVELFNPDYAQQDPLLLAKTALGKTRRAIVEALSVAS